MTDTRTSSIATAHVFVLWGEKFEEEIAAIFITEMRRIGVRVKLVGVTGHSAAGRHGLTLRPDILLGDALLLADSAICVVLPCELDMVKRLQEDPRAMSFLAQAAQNQAQFIVRKPAIIAETDLAKLALSSADWVCYQACDDLFEFIRNIAMQLFNVTVADR